MEAEAIARVARPIHGEDEIDQLVDLVGRARIVLLGESTHGTHEFYEMRSALTRRLMVQKNFAAVAIEGDWPDALRADRYVRRLGDDESADAALASFQRFPTWMWRNEAIVELLDWMRTYNRYFQPAERAGFYGLDLYSLHASIRAVLSFLEDADPELATKARERYACFDHASGDPQRYGLHAFHGLEGNCEGEVIDQLVEMQRRHAARSGRTPGGDAWFQAIQNAHVVRDAEAYYRTMFGGRSASWNLRDTHMADTLDLLAEHLGGKSPAKIVVWAHNSHVGDARYVLIEDTNRKPAPAKGSLRHEGGRRSLRRRSPRLPLVQPCPAQQKFRQFQPDLDPAMPRPVLPVALELEEIDGEDDAALAGGLVLSGLVAREILGDGRVSPRIPPLPAPLKRQHIRLADQHHVGGWPKV